MKIEIWWRWCEPQKDIRSFIRSQQGFSLCYQSWFCENPSRVCSWSRLLTIYCESVPTRDKKNETCNAGGFPSCLHPKNSNIEWKFVVHLWNSKNKENHHTLWEVLYLYKLKACLISYRFTLSWMNLKSSNWPFAPMKG